MADAPPPVALNLQAEKLGAAHAFLTAAQSEAKRFDLCSHKAEPVFVKQVHSARVMKVEQPFAPGALPEADAMVTDQPGIMLAIVTADCAPVLFADPVAGVIGAAHAGWRGAHGGIAAATINAMEQLGASAANIRAAIGPCIMQQSYEVDEAFRDQFTQSGDERFFIAGKAGHWQFDLPGYVAAQMIPLLGAEAVTSLQVDTYSNPAHFHSFRRATHRAEPSYGRQFSLIALPA